MNDALNRTTTAFRPLDTTTALRPARLLCPSCRREENRESVLESAMVDGTEFHRCAACGGVWFNVKDLDVALAAAGRGEWPAPKIKETPADEHHDNHGWGCPCCAGQLIAVRDRHGEGIRVRRCLVCYGGWIEYPDLLRAGEAAGGILSRLGRVVRGALQPKA